MTENTQRYNFDRYLSPSVGSDVKQFLEKKDVKGALGKIKANVILQTKVKYRRVAHFFETFKNEAAKGHWTEVGKALSKAEYFNNKGK